MVTKDQVMEKLEDVIDPELYISVVDLGLIYDVEIKDKDIDIKMTLTTIGCPLFGLIEGDIKEKVSSLGDVGKVHVDLVFDPPWDMEKMSERGKAQLGI